MSDLRQVASEYSGVDCRDMGSRSLEALKSALGSISPASITSLDDGKLYLTLLHKFREAIAENDKLHGENYPKLLSSLLSVGEDGLYSNNLRFIFELIQNVDDCDFPNPEGCTLDMQFVPNEGKIILRYNEKGFSPFNVFAITGIAEAAKNISSGRIEIGEKGIGFKSVFGVSESVLIQSGFFSFILNKSNFTIPIAAYDNYQPVQGTQMTLFADPVLVESIYGQIATQYCDKKALLSKNPLLFLNKLTNLRFYCDTFRSLSFSVSRTGTQVGDTVLVEPEVVISANLHDHRNAQDKLIQNEIKCIRYTIPITYDKAACQSRYGMSTAVAGEFGKKMTLSLVAPYVEDLSQISNGALYSFLPTQVPLNVPFAIHAPFKLDASREFVDPQDNSRWFTETCSKLHELLMYAYQDLAQRKKQDIVYYLPDAGKSIFDSSNEKINCLVHQNQFKAKEFFALPVFCAEDGKYYSAQNIICINEENTPDPHIPYALLNCSKALFIPPASIKMGRFSVEVLRDINKKIFASFLYQPELTDKCLDYLSDQVERSALDELVSGALNKTDVHFSSDQIISICRHKNFYKFFKSHCIELLQNKQRPGYAADISDVKAVTEYMYEDFSLSDVPNDVQRYLSCIKLNCAILEGMPSGSFFVAHNTLVLSKKDRLQAFANLCGEIDSNDLFSANLKIRTVSQSLNNLSEDISSEEYMKQLRSLRQAVRDALGKRAYNSYISLIQKSGTDSGRFVNELLQNADDCHFPEGVEPSFSLKIDGRSLTTWTNEIGFDRNDVRAITSIGESTKEALLSNGSTTIGEKGVGFKTVFSVASEAKIFSGDFCFKLTDEEPTIPKRLQVEERQTAEGTTMVFDLKNRISNSDFSESLVLTLCLCLRKLKHIQIGIYDVAISDTDHERIVAVNGSEFRFLKTDYSFFISEEEASRRKDRSRTQHILCYALEDFSGKQTLDYRLYCGLPTEIKLNIPMSIDAPLDLNTSRDLPLRNDWNMLLKPHLYSALIQFMVNNRERLRTHVLDFLHFESHSSGVINSYIPAIFNQDDFNHIDLTGRLRNVEFLPTLDEDIFVSPADHGKRYPSVMEPLIRAKEEIGAERSLILDVGYGDKYSATLNALECKIEPISNVLFTIKRFAAKYIQDERFRTRLYSFLKNSTLSDEHKKTLRAMPIIPVYGINTTKTIFVQWQTDKIFTKPNFNHSSEMYYVLNESVLNKRDCEEYLGVTINQMDTGYEQSRYKNELKEKINSLYFSNPAVLYGYIQSEYESGRITHFMADDVLLLAKRDHKLPLKNNFGEITCGTLFRNTYSLGDFNGEILNHLIVAKECTPLALLLGYNELSYLQYEDIPSIYKYSVSNDDIEDFSSEYLLHSAEILKNYISDCVLTEQQIADYSLDFLNISDGTSGEQYPFPNEPVRNLLRLQNGISQDIKNPSRIQEVQELRTVWKINYKGQPHSINSAEVRYRTIRRYSPATEICFCQICKKQKNFCNIEVNNIERQPRYYWPQMRVALCLECSKWFESIRNNKHYYDAFLSALRSADTSGYEPIEIPIGQKTITFTQTHLAEIQEILLQQK